MEDLELKYDVMQECMNDIQRLITDYPTVERPSVSGFGQSITEIEHLADLYATFHEELRTLSAETVKYLSDMVEEFKETDEKRARN